MDGKNIKGQGQATDRVHAYTIYPVEHHKQVYCDMTTENGVWTLNKGQGHDTDWVYTNGPCVIMEKKITNKTGIVVKFVRKWTHWFLEYCNLCGD